MREIFGIIAYEKIEGNNFFQSFATIIPVMVYWFSIYVKSRGVENYFSNIKYKKA